jgi:polyphenol oxidase
LVKARIVVGTRWNLGQSLAPFDRGNVAGHVGDDVDAVAANRADIARLANLDFRDVVIMAPAHGADAIRLSSAEEVADTPLGRVAPEADALITTTPGIGLLTMAADCAPVTLADEQAGVIGVVHVGWKGLVRGVLARAVQEMQQCGAECERIQVNVHACICAQHYPVPPERAASVRQACPNAVVTLHDGNEGVDLRLGLAQQCSTLGLQQVHVDSRCTFEDPDLFSHRRDGMTGRHGVLMVLQ